jgi:uncharacterized protein YjbK
MAEDKDVRGHDPVERRNDFKELLLKEYDRLSALFRGNEEMGERRVTFFITLTGAVLAALISLFAKGGARDLRMPGYVATASLLVLLLFGIFTLRRIVTRNRATDDLKAKLDRIRKYFVEKNDKSRVDYLPFNPYAAPPPREAGLFYGSGGLMETVMLMNSIVAGAALAFLHGAVVEDPFGCGPLRPAGWRILAGVLGTLTTWFIQVITMRRTFRQERIPVPREVEAKLVAVAETEKIKRELAEIDEIAGYRLCKPHTVTITDRIFDTQDGRLHQQGLLLRTRKVGRRSLLTLKGPSTIPSNGLADRLEIELPANADSRRRLLHELAVHGIYLMPSGSLSRKVEVALKSLGLGERQRRDTGRMVRAAKDYKGRTVAELAFDVVTYHVGDARVRHQEIEVEAKSKGGRAAVVAISGALETQFKGSLRRWAWSKTATGRALKELLEAGEAAGLLEADGTRIRAAGYSRLSEALSASQPGVSSVPEKGN